MTRLHDDCNAFWLEYLVDGKRYLLRQPFLDLQAAGEHLCNAGKLRQAKDAAVRDVSNVHLIDVNMNVT